MSRIETEHNGHTISYSENEDAYELHLRSLMMQNYPRLRPIHACDFVVDKTATKVSWWRRLKRWLMRGIA